MWRTPPIWASSPPAALAVFAVVGGLLVAIKKDSPLNVLTHVWTSLILLLVFETIALLIVMFGGLLTVV